MAKRDNARVARLLAEAALTTEVCDRKKIMLRTLQSYREALKTNPELSRLYAEARQG